MSNAELDDDRINDRIHFAQRTVLEVCGVDLNGNGRSCNAPHICCGNHVNHGDIVYLKTDLQTNNDGEIEDVVISSRSIVTLVYQLVMLVVCQIVF
jgi:hypothetical protein